MDQTPALIRRVRFAHEAVLADSVGLALLVVLETLAPAERLAFVLHDMFAVSFDEIAPIVGRTRAARPALVNGAVGLVVAPRGKLVMVLRFTITGGKIAEIDVVADPERLRQLELAVLD